MLKSVFAVCLGGAIGSLLRYLTGVWFAKNAAGSFPAATFTVNIVGSFLIGALYALSAKQQWFAGNGKLLLITGFCGGLTTFSAFAYENIKLLQQGNAMLFVLYSFGSLGLSLLAVVTGMYVIRLF